MRNKIAFVILNHKTAEETIILLQNIYTQSWYQEIKIYVVDNYSNDGSIDILLQLTEIDFELIISPKNIGFANGNNLGIKKAQKDGFNFIVCSNSDIEIPYQENFLESIFHLFNRERNIAIIAPDIQNLEKNHQNPFRQNRFSKKEIIQLKLFYRTGFYQLYYFFRVYIFYDFITTLSKKRKQKKALSQELLFKKSSSYIYAPQGSFLIFTPRFFEFYTGFDSHTFLYCEELLLAEMLREKNLLCWLESSLNILHKESLSTNKVNNNYKDKVKFTLKNTFKSCKYFSKIVK